jgi:hypothetical protein
MKPKVCAILAFLLLLVVANYDSLTGQVRFKIPLAYADSVFQGGDDPTDTITGLTFLYINRDTLWFGVHDLATFAGTPSVSQLTGACQTQELHGRIATPDTAIRTRTKIHLRRFAAGLFYRRVQIGHPRVHRGLAS